MTQLTSVSASGRSRAVPGAVFLVFACLYALSIGRGFYTSDGEVMFKTAAALVEQKTFALRPDPGLPQIVRGQNGTFYSKYDPGLPLLAVPFYAAGDRIAAINHAHRYRLAATFVLLVPTLAAAGTLAALSTFAASVSRKPAIGVVLAAGLATPLWYYARVLFAESVLACALTAAVLVIESKAPGPQGRGLYTGSTLKGAERGPLTVLPIYSRVVMQIKNLTRIPRLFTSPLNPLSKYGEGTCGPRVSPSPRVERGPGGEVNPAREYPRYFPEEHKGAGRGPLTVLPIYSRVVHGPATLCLAGAIFGAGILTRAALAIYLPALAWLIARRSRQHRPRAIVIRLAAFGIGMLPFVAALLWHNMQRFDAPFRFGYAGEGFTTPPWEGVCGLLFSPGKSVFLYAPPLALSLALWPRFRRVYPALAQFLALAWGTALVFYGVWWAWHGGWSWGPRLLVPLMPLSCLPLIMLPGGRVWRGVAAALIVAGIAGQVSGVLTDLTPHYAALAQGDRAGDAALYGHPRQSPLVAALDQVIHGQTEPLGLFHLKETGLPPTWTLGVPLVLVTGVLAGTLILFRRSDALFREFPGDE